MDRILKNVWTAIQARTDSLSSDEEEEWEEAPSFELTTEEIAYMDSVLTDKTPFDMILGGATHLLSDPDSDPGAYEATAIQLRSDLDEARMVIEKARASGHPGVEKLTAKMEKAEEIVPVLEHRFKRWNDSVDARVVGYLQEYEIYELLEQKVPKNKLNSLSPCDAEETNDAEENLANLQRALAVQQRLSLQLDPLKEAHFFVQVFDADIEQLYQRAAALESVLSAEIEEEKALNESIDQIGNDIVRIERMLGWIPGVEQRVEGWEPDMDNLKIIHAYKIRAVSAQLELLEYRSQAADDAPRKFVKRDTVLIENYAPKLEYCKRELAEIFKNETESDKAVQEIAAQLRKLARETPIGFLPLDKIDNLERQLKNSGTLAAWAQLREIDMLRKKHADAKSLKSSRFDSEFWPEEVIGAGTFGCVIRAKNLMDSRMYALKRITLKPSEELNTKVLDEVLRMAKLHHPGIVRYHNAWIERSSETSQNKHLHLMEGFDLLSRNMLEDSGLFLFIQMELCNESLTHWLNRNMGHRDHKQMVSWFRQIMSALEYIHSQNMFHRDLKPMNILVVTDSIVKICDLGIATDSVIDSDSMPWRTNIGTQMYKAPEQCTCYDAKVDIFSCGLILLEMCAPLTEMQRIEIFNDIRCGKAVKILQDQPEALDLVAKLTSLDKDHRPSFEAIRAHSFFDDE